MKYFGSKFPSPSDRDKKSLKKYFGEDEIEFMQWIFHSHLKALFYDSICAIYKMSSIGIIEQMCACLLMEKMFSWQMPNRNVHIV